MTRKVLRTALLRNDFLQLLSASFVRNSEAVTRGVLKKDLLKNFAIFTGKHQCRDLFLIKLKKSDSKKIFFKKQHKHRCFSANTAKFLRTYFEKHLQMTTSVNFRAAVFQSLLYLLNEMPSGILWQHALALPLKWNALTFWISWQHTHSNPVGIFSHFWQLHHSW